MSEFNTVLADKVTTVALYLLSLWMVLKTTEPSKQQFDLHLVNFHLHNRCLDGVWYGALSNKNMYAACEVTMS